MLQRWSKQFFSLALVLDGALAGLAYLLLVRHFVTPGEVTVFSVDGSTPLLGVGLLSALSWPLALNKVGGYQSQRRATVSQLALCFLQAGAISMGVVAFAAYLMRPPLPPYFPLLCGATQIGVLASVRFVVLSGLRILRRRGRNFRTVAIVGSGSLAHDAIESIDRHPEWGIRVVAILDEVDVPFDDRIPGDKLRKLIEFPELLQEEPVDEVIVACPRSMLNQITQLVGYCATTGIPIVLFSDLFGDAFPAPRVTRFDSKAALSFEAVHHNVFMLGLKRSLDIVLSGSLLVIFSPIIGIGAACIWWFSPGGSVIFRQQRCGLLGRRFEMVKLRTMVKEAEAQQVEIEELNEMDGPIFKVRNDPRITPVGRVLRRWSVDELPQLWNVLIGDMSLVGPRPPIPKEVSQYSPTDRRRLSMRPGITCTWQVSGRSLIGFTEWVKLDIEYIENWSMRRDLTLLLKTVPAVLRGTGAI